MVSARKPQHINHTAVKFSDAFNISWMVFRSVIYLYNDSVFDRQKTIDYC